MTVDQCYTFIQFMIRKNQIGQVTPDEFAMAFNAAQTDYFSFLMGNEEGFQPGKPVPPVALGMSNRIAERLATFKMSNVLGNVASGSVPYPDDFLLLVLLTTPQKKKIERIDDIELPDRLASKIDPIAENPCYVEDKDKWNIYPAGLSQVFITYYRLPAQVKWAYTLNGQGRPVYDANNSVSPEWDDRSCRNILGRTAKYLGFSFSAQNLVEYGMEVKQTGS